MSKEKIDLSIVLPCYNEMEHITYSIKELIFFLENTHLNYEIIIIDDCSIDGTAKTISALSKKYPQLRVYLHSQNIGRGGTVSEGIKKARGEVVGFIDIDLEVPQWYILPAYILIKNGHDIVTANRIYRIELKGIVRWILNRGYNLLVRNFLNVPFRDTEAGFKFFNKKMVITILDEIKDTGWFWDTEVIVRSFLKGYKIKELPTLFIKNNNKTSTVRIFKDSMNYLINLARFRREIKK